MLREKRAGGAVLLLPGPTPAEIANVKRRAKPAPRSPGDILGAKRVPCAPGSAGSCSFPRIGRRGADEIRPPSKLRRTDDFTVVKDRSNYLPVPTPKKETERLAAPGPGSGQRGFLASAQGTGQYSHSAWRGSSASPRPPPWPPARNRRASSHEASGAPQRRHLVIPAGLRFLLPPP